MKASKRRKLNLRIRELVAERADLQGRADDAGRSRGLWQKRASHFETALKAAQADRDKYAKQIRDMGGEPGEADGCLGDTTNEWRRYWEGQHAKLIADRDRLQSNYNQAAKDREQLCGMNGKLAADIAHLEASLESANERLAEIARAVPNIEANLHDLSTAVACVAVLAEQEPVTTLQGAEND